MKPYILFSFLFLALLTSSPPDGFAGSNGKRRHYLNADTLLSNAVSQYRKLLEMTPDGVMPRSYDITSDTIITSDTQWWTSGFYPGTLLYLYEFSRDQALLKEAEQRLSILEKEKYFTGNHDLGFMIFCSFGNALRISGDTSINNIILTAAESLSTRYRPAVRAIQSWEAGKTFHCPVIIDNMMNLELLCWASDLGGNRKYREIAVSHANTTLKNHFRKNGSSCHVVDYDPDTGNIIRKMTWQGLSDSSSWARGQSWGLYGFTMMYRFTKDKMYLKKARSIARYCLSHPNLPDDLIPYWDYDARGSQETYRDASAAAIMASALIELSDYVNGNESRYLLSAAEKIILTLSGPEYTAAEGTNGGFILKHSVGALPFNSEVDVPLTYADYYYIEALMRLKQHGKTRISYGRE